MQIQTTQTETHKPYSIDGRKVLLIDAAMQPIAVVPLKAALIKLYSSEERKRKDIWFAKPSVIAYSEDGALIGVKRDIPVPSIIQLGRVVPIHRQRVRFCRKSIFARDEFTCQYCGGEFKSERLTYEHVVPRAQGGKTSWENVVTACIDCNQRKANRTPEQANMKLLSKPAKPTYVMQVKARIDYKQMPKEWAEYWTVTLEK
jgi:5-methylcytosine-specific restriction endonuclease McrA